MTHFARTAVINAIYERGLVPSFSAGDLNEARSIVKACADGGARVILCRIQNAIDVQFFGSLVEELQEQERDVILGAGHSLHMWTEIREREDGWVEIDLTPDMMYAMAVGDTDGLALQDGGTLAYFNNFIHGGRFKKVPAKNKT